MSLRHAKSLRQLLIFGIFLACGPGQSFAQLILNEANAVGAEEFLQTDDNFGLEKPYEGYDFGVFAYSGNDNPVSDPVRPGNPFPLDLDSLTPGEQTTLPNGWDRSQPTGLARIQGNGGDWMELVVSQDHTDLRGYTLYWENDEDFDFLIGENGDERGFIKFTDNKAFANLRAGTILTLSEDGVVLELRDQFPDEVESPLGPPPHQVLNPDGSVSTIDLSTDLSFDPFTGDDWHVHFHVDESLTDLGIATEYFEGFSDAKVDNDLWQMAIYDATNTAIQAEANDDGVAVISDLATGLIESIRGEANISGISVNNQEVFTRRLRSGRRSHTVD